MTPDEKSELMWQLWNDLVRSEGSRQGAIAFLLEHAVDSVIPPEVPADCRELVTAVG